MVAIVSPSCTNTAASSASSSVVRLQAMALARAVTEVVRHKVFIISPYVVYDNAGRCVRLLLQFFAVKLAICHHRRYNIVRNDTSSTYVRKADYGTVLLHMCFFLPI